MNIRSWCKQDYLQRFVFVLIIRNWTQLAVKTTSRYFIDQMLECLGGHEYYYFLDGYSGYNQIPIAVEDQEKTTFTCPFGIFTYRRMPFGLCNAPATFQLCMLSLFSDMVEFFVKIFMNDFSIYGDSFDQCFHHLELVLQRCKEKKLNSKLRKLSLPGKIGDCLKLWDLKERDQS